jgi:hypothetical protein
MQDLHLLHYFTVIYLKSKLLRYLCTNRENSLEHYVF